MKFKIIEQINRHKEGMTIQDLVKEGFKLATIRSIILQLENENIITSKKIGTTKIYFLIDQEKSESLISLIKRAKAFNLPIELLFRNKELFVQYYTATVVTKSQVEDALNLTNASVLTKNLEAHNLIRVIKKKPLEFCFKQNDAIELFLDYMGTPASKRIRYDYNKLNATFLTPADIEYLEQLKSEYIKSINFYTSKKDAFNRFMGYFIYNTCGIEGNKISLHDTPSILQEGRIPTNIAEEDYVDFMNSKDVVSKVLINNDFKRDLNHELILSINKKILDRLHCKAGEYRSKGYDLRPFGRGFQSTPGEYVKIDIDILIKLYYNMKKDGVHPLIIATVFHHKFEKIHPFYEGNGRTGRILSNYILMRAGFPPLVVEKKNKRRYYSALTYADENAKDLREISATAYHKLFKYFYKQLIHTYHITIKI